MVTKQAGVVVYRFHACNQGIVVQVGSGILQRLDEQISVSVTFDGKILGVDTILCNITVSPVPYGRG